MSEPIDISEELALLEPESPQEMAIRVSEESKNWLPTK